MFKAAASLAILAMLTGCAGGPRTMPRDQIDRALRGAPGKAQPSDIVATEMALARMVQEKGYGAGFREFATKDAVIFVPQAENAEAWIKQKPDLDQSTIELAAKRQTHHVWMSCDATLAVTKGAWQASDGTSGFYLTAWERQKDRSYKWVMDQTIPLAEPLDEPDIIQTSIAKCAPDPVMGGDVLEAEIDSRSRKSLDGSLIWVTNVLPDCSRNVYGRMQNGKAYDRFAFAAIDAPAKERQPANGCGRSR